MITAMFAGKVGNKYSILLLLNYLIALCGKVISVIRWNFA